MKGEIMPWARILHPEKLYIGEHSRIDDFTLINCAGGVRIGQYCCIHAGCRIIGNGGLSMDNGSVVEYNTVIVTSTSDPISHMSTMIPREFKEVRKAKVDIGKEVFIGPNSLIMPGVKIGDGAVIGALSYVDKDIPEGMIYNRGKLKKREFEPRFDYD